MPTTFFQVVNTCLYVLYKIVLSNLSLNLSGSVEIGEGVTFMVEEGSELTLDEALCVIGPNTIIEVDASQLNILNSTLVQADSLQSWEGIRVKNASSLTMNNSIVSNAIRNSVKNSTLLIQNCRFDVPSPGTGLTISNPSTGYETIISNSSDGFGFFGSSNQYSKGLILGSINNNVVIHNVTFKNLSMGIYKVGVANYIDSITNCRFNICHEGIKFLSVNNNARIEECNFVANIIGIRLIGTSPRIDDCTFFSCTKGILAEFTLQPSEESGVFSSLFTNQSYAGIESRSSNLRLETNYLTHNLAGIVNHSGSNLNLAYHANNVLNNSWVNILFHDSFAYASTIQLFTGHNDFYHEVEPDSTAWDFYFDDNYYNFPLNEDFTIDADKNWFQDDIVRIYDPNHIDYVSVEVFDPSPTMPAPPQGENRLQLAFDYESQGLISEAITQYQKILDDKLASEEKYYPIAADGVYRLSYQLNDPSWDIVDYFDATALQYSIEEPYMYSLLQDYIAKILVVNENYQGAIDLIEIRLANAVSEIDSLLAVMDLEIVLQLSQLDDIKKPITTKYSQYKYPDTDVFSVKHDDHWSQLYKLLNKNNEVAMQLPKKPLIKSNYPNPFNPSTTISFSIPSDARIRMNVYNLRGQKVRKLIDGDFNRGHHQVVWNGRDDRNRSVGSGLYLIRLESQGKVHTRKVMLMK